MQLSDSIIELQVKPLFPSITSLTVATDDEVLYEWYSSRAGSERLCEIRSITKSVVSVIYGELLERRLVPPISARLVDVLPNLRGWRESRKHEITIEHVLSMTTGLEWFENGHSTRYWLAAEAPLELVCSLPLVHRPGSVFKYSNFAVHFISAVINQATRTSMREVGKTFLFDRLGVGEFNWPALADGRTDAASRLELRVRDLVQFGRFCLQKHLNESTSGLPTYFRDAVRPHVQGLHPEFAGYGYLWWTHDESSPNSFFASGYGGQRLQLFPAWKMIVCTTGNPATERERLPNMHMVTDVILKTWARA